MSARAWLVSLCLLATATAAFAEQPPPQPRTQAPPPGAQPRTPPPQPATTPPPAAAAVPRERREGQPVNIKVDVTITDQRGAAQALKKTLTVVTGDMMGGFIRSTARYASPSVGEVPLNVDVEPVLIGDGSKIRVRVNLQYDLPAPVENPSERGPGGPLTKTQIHESLSLILENGKPLVAAQSADPVGDRQVTIEVKATVLR